jgi:hypothetical protein
MNSSMTGARGNIPTGSSSPRGATMTTGSSSTRAPKGYETGKLQNFTPEMMDLFKNMFSQVNPGSYLSRLASGDESLFEEMERPAMRQFQGLQSQTASQFSGAGMGARRGSGFRNTINQQTSDFAGDLQSKRQGMQRQAINDLMGLSGDLLNQRPYENYLVPKSKPWWQEALTGIAKEGVSAGVKSMFHGASAYGGGG